MGVSLSKSVREVCSVKLQNAKVRNDLETLVHANLYFALAPFLRLSRDKERKRYNWVKREKKRLVEESPFRRAQVSRNEIISRFAYFNLKDAMRGDEGTKNIKMEM